MKRALLILRAAVFSPSMQDKDAAILMAVKEELRERGIDTSICSEEALERSMLSANEACTASLDEDYDLLIHMARSKEALRLLASFEQKGIPVLNSAQSLLQINRTLLLQESRKIGISVPPFAIGERGDMQLPFWWKRDDEVSQRADDVLLVRSEEEWKEIQKRGIAHFVVEKHIEGDLLKFYSVRGTSFFHWNYPTYSKFGKEQINGKTKGYPFNERQLKEQADLLAEAVGLDIFGGDAIVDENGRFYLIDVNDWPSFSSCRENAAKAIAEQCVMLNA